MANRIFYLVFFLGGDGPLRKGHFRGHVVILGGFRSFQWVTQVKPPYSTSGDSTTFWLHDTEEYPGSQWGSEILEQRFVRVATQ